MSGGFFDYNQYRINDIIEQLQEVIDKNKKEKEPNERDRFDSNPYYFNYSDDVMEEFKKGLHYLKLAKIYTQRIDYLLEGDDGEDSFRKRLKEELDELL